MTRLGEFPWPQVDRRTWRTTLSWLGRWQPWPLSRRMDHAFPRGRRV